MKKTCLIAGLLVGGALVAYGIDLLAAAGAFRSIAPHYAGTCTAIEGVVGVEDITIDAAGGIAYLSNSDRRALVAGGDGKGAIYLYRAGSHATPIKLPNDMAGDFNPHGISLWFSPDDRPGRLFVINHPGQDPEGLGRSQVEIFEIGEAGLHHVATVKPDAPISFNDIAAVGPESFYASVDKGSTSKLGRALETWLRLPRAGLAYGTTDGIRFVTTGLKYANGVQASPDSDLVFAAESIGQRVVAFRRDLETGALDEVASANLRSGLDNIEFAPDGSLWIGAHPRMFDFLGHAKDAAKRSPSQVLKVLFDGDHFAPAEEIYLNDGDPLSGSSVAAPYAGGMLVGGVFDPLMLDCRQD